jgi:3-deoxy-D-arabino-heptulosonate 7-phosphate (DAHP) synthase
MCFLDHTLRRITDSRTLTDEGSASRTDLYLTTRKTHNRQTSRLPVLFEPTNSADERQHTYALDSVATGIGANYRLMELDKSDEVVSNVCCTDTIMVSQEPRVMKKICQNSRVK